MGAKSCTLASYNNMLMTHLCILQIVNVSEGSGTCSGMPELLLASSLVLSIMCLFVFPCVLVCTIPAIVASVTVSSQGYCTVEPVNVRAERLS